MGRFTAGNNADPDRLQRVLDAKQRLIGVSAGSQYKRYAFHYASKWYLCSRYTCTGTQLMALLTCAGGCASPCCSGGGQEARQGAGEGSKPVSALHQQACSSVLRVRELPLAPSTNTQCVQQRLLQVATA
jgi:hypothetical protein